MRGLAAEIGAGAQTSASQELENYIAVNALLGVGLQKVGLKNLSASFCRKSFLAMAGHGRPG